MVDLLYLGGVNSEFIQHEHLRLFTFSYEKMGRVKGSIKRKSILNKYRAVKRWEYEKNFDTEQNIERESVENQQPEYTNPRPRLIDFNNPRPSTSNDDFQYISPEQSSSEDSEDEMPNKRERPTGFALTSSYKTPVDDIEENAPAYCLMDLTKLTKFLEELPCKYCLDTNSEIVLSKKLGFAQEIAIHCHSCGQINSFETSQKLSNEMTTTRPSYDVNRRIIKTFCSLGKGHMGLQTLSMGMNMPCINHSAYDKQIKIIQKAAKQHTEESLKRARVEVEKVYSVLKAYPDFDMPKPIDIAVSYDGSWQKRGFTSKYGVGSVIELITGLVIDYEVVSKYCRVCEKKKTEVDEQSDEYENWYIDHQPSCQANFEGSSPAMEVEAAERLWRRSEKAGFRYTSVISDGDSKTFDHLVSLKIYGDKVPIEKQECVNHVAKRLGTGLRNLVKDCAKKKITLGGKAHGSLKGTTIDKLTKYYRNAVIANLEDTAAMKRAIFATLDHCQSTDENPLHEKCPVGKDSWCFYQRDIANGVLPRKHEACVKTPLNAMVVEHLMPLYTRLTAENLLKRCSLGKTQNANEALHGVIWSKCPKTIFTSKMRVEAGVAEGISVYNEGYLLTMTKLLKTSGISPGRTTVLHAQKKDATRLRLRQTRKTEKYQKYRKMKKFAQLREEEEKKSREGTTYGAGEF